LDDNDLTGDPAKRDWSDRIGELLGEDTLLALRKTSPNPDGYRDAIRILDQGMVKAHQTNPQPDPEVIAEFMRMCTCLHEPKGYHRFYPDGSIRRCPSQGRRFYTALIVRPRLAFPEGGIRINDLRIAGWLRERLKTIMREVERRERFRSFLGCDEVFEY
jgi:hypothetical protein